MPPPSARVGRGERPIGERLSSNPSLVRFVIAVIPAHNEEHGLARTLRSLANQTRPVDAVIVVADNCTDATVAIALATGASVVETVDNSARKAGALNFALAEVLPLLDPTDAVLLMDADTQLSDGFVAAATTRLWREQQGREVGAVGGIFTSDDEASSMVGQLQTNEYVRYARHLGRRQGRALVITGTGSVFSVGALRAVVDGRRNGTLPDPGGTGGVYDTSALTEDNELTLCLKALHYRTVSPAECLVFTEIMPTWKMLYQQRRRWQRGAMENLLAHGLHAYTLPYITKQALTYLGVLFVPFYFVTLFAALTSAVGGGVDAFVPFWVLVAVTYVIEQTWSVRRGGWRAMLLSIAIVPELLFNLFLNTVYAFAIIAMLFGTSEQWGRRSDEGTVAHRAEGGDDPTGAMTVSPAARSTGSHGWRAAWWARIIESSAALLVGFGMLLVFTIPFGHLPTAWMMMSIYVVCGFLATVFRLIPLPMS